MILFDLIPNLIASLLAVVLPVLPVFNSVRPILGKVLPSLLTIGGTRSIANSWSISDTWSITDARSFTDTRSIASSWPLAGAGPLTCAGTLRGKR